MIKDFHQCSIVKSSDAVIPSQSDIRALIRAYSAFSSEPSVAEAMQNAIYTCIAWRIKVR